jgi:predicted amidohydrolase
MIVDCRQISPVVGDFPYNRDLTAQAIAEAAASGADLVVLPELALSGYVFESQGEAVSMAIPRSHPVFDTWGLAAGRAVVVGGFCERDPSGLIYNSAAVVDSSGVLGVYRKVHLWDSESVFFAPGEDPPCVISTRAGELGTLICYDLEFPEMVRGLALAGAELVAVPTNWPLLPRPDGERPPEVINAMAAARVNRVAIACCDRAGAERGQEWTCGTTIIGADGWVAATASELGAARADLDLSESRDKAISQRNDALGDRKPAIYDALFRRQPA